MTFLVSLLVKTRKWGPGTHVFPPFPSPFYTQKHNNIPPLLHMQRDTSFIRSFSLTRTERQAERRRRTAAKTSEVWWGKKGMDGGDRLIRHHLGSAAGHFAV